jgi:V8-like Glu-specific endopeptidase
VRLADLAPKVVPVAAIVAATSALTSVFLAIDSSAQPSSRRDEEISSIQIEPSQGRASLWTEAWLRDAQALPLPVADPEAVRAEFKARFTGPPGGGSTEQGAPPPELGRRSGDVHSFPLNRVGRLFFNEPGDAPGKGHVCTAQFVAQNVLLTASHCVQGMKPPYAYHKNFMFDLQYEKGTSSRKYGTKCVANKKAWAQDSAARYLWDYAMILTDAPSDSGWFGLEWNWSNKYRRATKIGYPSGSFNGQIIQVDAGPLSVTKGLVEMHHGNKQVQHGSSGGGYVGDYSTDGKSNANHIISSESFSRGEEGETSGISYGPYYTEELLSLLNYTKAGCR